MSHRTPEEQTSVLDYVASSLIPQMDGAYVYYRYSPEQRLAAAVMLRAILDLITPPPRYPDRMDCFSAKRWVFEEGLGGYSFEFCCAALRECPHRTRRGIRRLVRSMKHMSGFKTGVDGLRKA